MSLDSLLECFKSSLKASAISVLSCKNNEYKLVKLITTQESLPSYTIFEGKVDSLTPFYAEGYQERFEAGEPQKQLSKEFVRE